MHVMSTLHINLTSVTNPQKIITKINGVGNPIKEDP
jgi:hypothetical protein